MYACGDVTALSNAQILSLEALKTKSRVLVHVHSLFRNQLKKKNAVRFFFFLKVIAEVLVSFLCSTALGPTSPLIWIQ